MVMPGEDTAKKSASNAPKRGRPSTAKLTEESIAIAALALIDERGWTRLTMNALATRLHVRAPSLYHYIEGQNDLINLVRALIVREIETDQLQEMSWEDGVRSFGMSYYRAFLRHPNAIQILSVTPINDRVTFQMYEAFLSALDRNGWSGDRALEILVGLEYLALGSAYEANASEEMLTAERAKQFGAPVMAKFLSERSATTSIVEDVFGRLLDDLIAMLRIERDREAAGSAEER